MTTLYFDAQDAIVGRLAAQTAKRLLAGDDVVIVNAQNATLSGRREWHQQVYTGRRNMNQKANPDHAPKQSWSRRPDLLLRRIVRGMLPKDAVRGRDALRKLRIYLGVPAEIAAQKPVYQPTRKPASQLTSGRTTLEQMATFLGWRGMPKTE